MAATREKRKIKEINKYMQTSGKFEEINSGGKRDLQIKCIVQKFKNEDLKQNKQVK